MAGVRYNKKKFLWEFFVVGNQVNSTDRVSLDKRAMTKEAIRMAWPAVLESFFVSLAGMIDTMMVASMGSFAVAAVGLTTQPKFIGLTPFFAINVAVSALVARRKGEKKQKSANQVLLTALAMAAVICIAVTFLSLVFADPIVRLAGSNDETHRSAVIYFRIIMGGTVFTMIQMLFNSAQRGSGNTLISMTTNVISSTVNICFNYLLIGGHFGFPALGITGAAIATVLGSAVAAAISFGSLFKKTSYVSIPLMIKEKVRPLKEVFRSIIKLASNMMVENFAMRIGFVTTAFIAARLGTDVFAAHNVGMNLLSLSFSFADGMQAAGVALTGQALGAKHKEEAKMYGSICQQIGMCISAVLAILILLFSRQFFSFYFSEEHILDMGVLIGRFLIFIVWAQIAQIIYGACLRAAGDVRYALISSLVSCTLIRTLATILLVNVLHMGLAGIWIGIMSDQVSRFIFMSIRFRQGKWVDIKI